MRYTVHTHRTFHHRITKYLGVLVGAALVATLGLPSAAQAQDASGAATLTAQWLHGRPGSTTPPLLQRGGRNDAWSDSDQGSWLFEYTEPGVAWDDATSLTMITADDTVDDDLLMQRLSPRMTHGSITASGDLACPSRWSLTAKH